MDELLEPEDDPLEPLELEELLLDEELLESDVPEEPLEPVAVEISPLEKLESPEVEVKSVQEES